MLIALFVLPLNIILQLWLSLQSFIEFLNHTASQKRPFDWL